MFPLLSTSLPCVTPWSALVVIPRRSTLSAQSIWLLTTPFKSMPPVLLTLLSLMKNSSSRETKSASNSLNGVPVLLTTLRLSPQAQVSFIKSILSISPASFLTTTTCSTLTQSSELTLTLPWSTALVLLVGVLVVLKPKPLCLVKPFLWSSLKS